MSQPPSEEKKIIVDEDWKSQVESEKEVAEAARQKSTSSGDGTPDAGAGSASDPEGVSGQEGFPLPPADFTTIISMLATQAMINLGTVPNPMTGKVDLNLPQAKHAIDLVEVLQKKTKGNCTPQEELMLENLLHEMRMAFVAVQNAPVNSGADENTVTDVITGADAGETTN